MKWLLVCLLALVPVAATAAGVEASLDRSEVALGETVTLNITAPGTVTGMPDLSPLQQDFDVLGSSSSTRLSVVNGRRDLSYTLGIALRPRHAGRLVVPSLEIGGERTAPLALQVTPPRQDGDHGGRIAFVEASAEPGQVKVGQQVLYTVRLFLGGNLSNGALSQPRGDGVDVRKLGDDIDYQAVRGGRSYRVIERHYALVPQQSGKLTIAPVQFQGQLIDPGDPDSFFDMGTPVAASSPPVQLDVQPVPAGWGSGAWLPARSLTLELSGMPADGKARVGEPIELSMTLRASGLAYEALPELSLPDLDGAAVYPDKPTTRTRSDGRWLLGERTRDFAVVPRRPGPLTLPAISITWWNVQTGKAQVARIPAQTLTVLPGAAGAAPAASAPAPAGAARAAPAPAPAASPAGRGRMRWVWLAALAAALVLAGAAWVAWHRRRGRVATARPARASELRRAFMESTRQNDPSLQSGRLLAWARAERPGLPHLGALAEALESAPQRQAIARLQQRAYGAAGTAQPDLAAAFARGFAWKRAAGGEDAPLPPLYPFKLR